MSKITIEKDKPLASIVLIIIALVLIFTGIKFGEHLSYFNKAIFICTQCIGIG